MDPEDGDPYPEESFLEYHNDHHLPFLDDLFGTSLPFSGLPREGDVGAVEQHTDGDDSGQATVTAPTAPASPCPTSPTQSAMATGMLIDDRPLCCSLPIASFTEDHVDVYFGFKVPKCKFTRMATLMHLWHHFHDHGIADFRFDGKLNVWGFNSVHVVDRKEWDAQMLATASGMARNVLGKPAKRPVQSIYEIIKYCGMIVKRCKREKPRVDKKALDQDHYEFDVKAFDENKHRAGGW